MKQFIIFIAITLIFSMSFVFQTDYNRVENVEKAVKSKLEDSASGAVFCIDETAYAKGYIKFDDEKIIDYVQHTLPDDYMTTITIFDEQMRMYEQDGALTGSAIDVTYPYIYIDENGYTSTVAGPSVKLTAVKETEDLYRLPFLKKTEIIRSTMYSWEERKDEDEGFSWFGLRP